MRIIHAAPDQAFHREDGIGGVCHCLTFGRLANKAFIVCEPDDRRRCARAFRIFNYPGLRAVHNGYARVGGPEVDPDDFGHDVYLFLAAIFWGSDPNCGP